jgi:uncharacterized protein (TIGR02217 family)
MHPSFHELRFPTDISLGATGGPERRTEIVLLGSGFEERNSRWAHSRRRYNAGYGVKSLDDLHAVIAFFEERRGRLHGFRWKDHADFRSCPPQKTPAASDQEIGHGDGATAAFQLVKTYGAGEAAYRRLIRKPVAGSLLLAVDGERMSEGEHFTLDAATGVIAFRQANVPEAGAIVTAGYEFDTPVRFDTDRLEIGLVSFRAGQIPDIPIVELRI